MERQCTDSDRKKRVVTSDGQTICRIRDVDNDRATVKQSDDGESLTDKITEMVGWSDDDETYELRRDDVHHYEDDVVHLWPRQ